MYINIYMHILIYIGGKDPVVLEVKEYSEYVYICNIGVYIYLHMCIDVYIYVYVYLYLYINMHICI
jgi:hypothetical protein